MRQISEGLIAGGCGECVEELQRAFSRNFRRPASRFGIPFRPAATATCRCQRSFAPTDIYHPTPSWTASTPINHHDRFRTSANPNIQSPNTTEPDYAIATWRPSFGSTAIPNPHRPHIRGRFVTITVPRDTTGGSSSYEGGSGGRREVSGLRRRDCRGHRYFLSTARASVQRIRTHTYTHTAWSHLDANMFPADSLPAAYYEERAAAEQLQRAASEQQGDTQKTSTASTSSLGQALMQRPPISRPNSSGLLGNLFQCIVKPGSMTPSPCATPMPGQAKQIAATEMERLIAEQKRDTDIVRRFLRRDGDRLAD